MTCQVCKHENEKMFVIKIKSLSPSGRAGEQFYKVKDVCHVCLDRVLSTMSYLK